MDKKTEEEFQAKIKENPKNGQVHADYAEYLALEAGKEKICEKQFQDALNLDSANAKIHLQYAKFCLNQKKIQEGYHHMERVMELEPNNGKMMVDLAGLWMYDDFQGVKMDNYFPDPVKVAKYDELYQKAFTLTPNDGDLHLTYGFYIFWIKKERYTELRDFISHFERAIELEPNSIGFKLDLAGILEIKGDPKYHSQIEQIYYELMEQNPNQNSILYMYRCYLQNTKRNPQAAEKIILQMIGNEPQNCYFGSEEVKNLFTLNHLRRCLPVLSQM